MMSTMVAVVVVVATAGGSLADLPNATYAPPTHLRLEIGGRGVRMINFMLRGLEPGHWPRFPRNDGVWCGEMVVLARPRVGRRVVTTLKLFARERAMACLNEKTTAVTTRCLTASSRLVVGRHGGESG